MGGKNRFFNPRIELSVTCMGAKFFPKFPTRDKRFNRPVLHNAITQSSYLLTLKRPPGVKFDPSLRFFFDNVFDVSYNDTNLRDFCHDKFPLGPHSGFVLLAITVFLKFRFSLPGVTFDPRWSSTS